MGRYLPAPSERQHHGLGGPAHGDHRGAQAHQQAPALRIHLALHRRAECKRLGLSSSALLVGQVTPLQAFVVAERYKRLTMFGAEPVPLEKRPRLDRRSYLPGFFLWMCLGSGYKQSTFKNMLSTSSKVLKKGERRNDRVYNVGSVLDLLHRKHRRWGRPTKNERR